MTEKARAGIYPSCAPVGYKNVDGQNGKRTIVPDPSGSAVGFNPALPKQS